jgi:hypothetical protein
METQNNNPDDLLRNAMQFGENELPEPDRDIYFSLRKKVIARKTSKNPFLRLLNFEVKLYQAALAVAVVAIICLVLRPATILENTNGTGPLVADTTTVFKGSSLKNDSFLVKNFTSTIY